jgi:hypothetical protein
VSEILRACSATNETAMKLRIDHSSHLFQSYLVRNESRKRGIKTISIHEKYTIHLFYHPHGIKKSLFYGIGRNQNAKRRVWLYIFVAILLFYFFHNSIQFRSCLAAIPTQFHIFSLFHPRRTGLEFVWYPLEY